MECLLFDSSDDVLFAVVGLFAASVIGYLYYALLKMKPKKDALVKTYQKELQKKSPTHPDANGEERRQNPNTRG